MEGDVIYSQSTNLVHHFPVVEIPRVGMIKTSNGICMVSEDGPFNLVQASEGVQIKHHSRLVVELGCKVYIDFGGGLVIDIKNADHRSDVVFYFVGNK